MTKLETDLELIEGKEDGEISNLTQNMDKVMKQTKEAIKKKQEEKKAADDEEKKKEYEAEYAYTP